MSTANRRFCGATIGYRWLDVRPRQSWVEIGTDGFHSFSTHHDLTLFFADFETIVLFVSVLLVNFLIQYATL